MNAKHKLTVEGLEKLKIELDKLKNVDRPRIIEAIKDAKAQGDLSENAEYDAAREEQGKVESRIKELEDIIKNSDVIDTDKKSNTNLGKTITLEFDDGFVDTYQLVGSLEANPFEGKISNESPVGKEILNAKVGEIIEVKNENGEKFTVKIKEIKETK